MTRPLRLRAAVCAGALALALPAATAVASTGPALPVPAVPASPTTDSPFYAPPAPLPRGSAGDLVKTEAVPLSNYPEARATRIMYLSRNTAGKAAPVTAVLLTPRDQPATGSGPVVVHTPGTRGLADHCAPSKQADPTLGSPQASDYSTLEYRQFLQGGVSVVLPDYAGAGTPGQPEYLVGQSEGYQGLDALRAAQKVEGSGLSRRSPVGISGYSQGGQAAAWAAELQPTYAAELDLKGVLAGGVPTDMLFQVNHLNGNPTGGAGFALASLVGLDQAYPKLDLEERLNADGRKLMERVSASCYSELISTFGTVTVADVTTSDVLLDRAWQDAYRASLLGTRRPGAPAYLYHNTGDTVVPFAQGRQLYGQWCLRGADVVFEEIVGPEHVVGAVGSTTPGITWLRDRLAGTSAPKGCRETSTPGLPQ